ncbi:MAG: hypothetical protein NTX03_08815 [Bacteroidetes bacterium]|nr:hypothetical protein [Bacteroidota bacterium]
MIKYLSIFTLLLFVFSCHQSHKLKITDLKFADYEKDQIAANNIDTTWVIYKTKQFDLVSNSYHYGDTFGYNTYNISGNLLREFRHQLGGHVIEYDYDSIGFIKHKLIVTDYSENLKPTYKFIADSHLLTIAQGWGYKSLITDTSLFYYDKEGNLIKTLEYKNKEGKFLYTSIHKYNQNGQLLKKVTTFIYDKNQIKYYFEMNIHEGIRAAPNKRIMNLFYTNNHLDSTIETTYHPNPKYNFTTKTYYDKLGLRAKTVERDSVVMVYSHKRRKK